MARKESLVLPLSDDEAAWAKNAIQATDLILLPLWFAAAVLTHQMSYILVGRKAKLVSAKELSECFADDKKAEI